MRSLFCSVALLSGLLLLVGCGKTEKYGQVEGVVKLSGKPLAGIYVVFMPDPEKGTFGPNSEAMTDDQGRYVLESLTGQEGAVVGWHRVVLTDTQAKQVSQDKLPPPPDASRVADRYSIASSTPLRFEVKEGKQTIDLTITRQ